MIPRRLALFLVFSALFCVAARAQYYTLIADTQTPAKQHVIDRVFSGNTPYLRVELYEKGTALDVSTWAFTFRYFYDRFDTNGAVTIPGVVTSSNVVSFLGSTNIFFEAYDAYYFSISGVSPAGYTKTFATGRMIQDYDPATGTNLPTMMGQINMDWWSNNVGVLVQEMYTGKLDKVAAAIYATGTPVYVESDPNWQAGTSALWNAIASAGGTNVFVESDPFWQAGTGAIWTAITDAPTQSLPKAGGTMSGDLVLGSVAGVSLTTNGLLVFRRSTDSSTGSVGGAAVPFFRWNGNSMWDRTGSMTTQSLTNALSALGLFNYDYLTNYEGKAFAKATNDWQTLRILSNSASIASIIFATNLPVDSRYVMTNDSREISLSGKLTASGQIVFGQLSSVDEYGTVLGGYSNVARHQYAAVLSGQQNIATGLSSVVSGGILNQAVANGTAVGGGIQNIANGYCSVVPGGQSSTAYGQHSFAAGNRAKALHDGAFVWGDSLLVAKPSQGDDTFNIWASGGTYFLDPSSNIYAKIHPLTGFQIGTAPFKLDAQGGLAEDWNLNSYTVSNGVFNGDGSGLTNLPLSSYLQITSSASRITSLALVSATNLGAELVYNGAFANQVGWNESGSITWDVSGKYIINSGLSGSLVPQTNLVIVAGKTYEVRYDLGINATGTVFVVMGGHTNAIPYTSSGSVLVESYPTSSSNLAFSVASSSGQQSFDNLSIKVRTSGDLRVSGNASIGGRLDVGGWIYGDGSGLSNLTAVSGDTFNTNLLESLANVSSEADPASGDCLQWNGTSWSNQTMSAQATNVQFADILGDVNDNVALSNALVAKQDAGSYATGTPVYVESDPALASWLGTNTYQQAAELVAGGTMPAMDGGALTNLPVGSGGGIVNTVVVQSAASTWDAGTGTLGLNTNDVPGAGGGGETNTITPAYLHIANNSTGIITIATSPNIRVLLTNAVQTIVFDAGLLLTDNAFAQVIYFQNTNSLTIPNVNISALTLSSTSTVSALFFKAPGETNITYRGSL